ncbi:MAG: GldG family protein [Chloroflexi bacterium]|nr:GldG family protein [Chloroflexota bacterium]
MRGDHRREPLERVRGDSESRLNLEKLKDLLVDAGPILSLSGAVILAGGLVVWLTVRELRGPAQVLISLALLMLLTSVVTHLPAVKSAVTARTGRYAANTLVMVAALTAILGLVGFISFENSYRLDVTATKQFTLAEQTKKVLGNLDEPVKAIVYSNPEDALQERVRRQADDFFFEFNQRNKKFTYEFIDPDLKPSEARRDGVTDYPTIVFKIQDSERNPYQLAPFIFGEEMILTEQDLVSAILISTGEQQKTVYFTTGHSERDSVDAAEDSDGYGLARVGLLGDNYLVRTLNLEQVDAIPEDAAVLIVAGPRSSVLQRERDKIEKYLSDGGRAMFLIDDAVNTQMNSLLNKWGVNLPQGSIVDLGSSTASDPRSPIVRRSAYNTEHPITKPLDDTFFTEATGIQDIIKRAPEGLPPNPDELNIALTPLAASSVLSCITTENDISDCSGEDDIFGPFALAMVIEAAAIVGEEAPRVAPGEELPIASIVVFGDSDFASNKFYYALNNSDLFLNAVDWLAQKYDLISIRSKPQSFRLLVIDQKEFDFIRYSSWFLLPTGIMLLAGIAWWRRR